MFNRQPFPTPAARAKSRKRQPRPPELRPSTRPKPTAGQGANTCAWCGQPLPDRVAHRGGHRRRFCSNSCRTLTHRRKSRLIATAAAAAFECPLADAERWLDQAGISRVTVLLKAAGIEFMPARRQFIDRAGRVYA